MFPTLSQALLLMELPLQGTLLLLITQELNVIFSEFNDRFELFAQENCTNEGTTTKITNIYNGRHKVLYEERVRVLSNSESDTKISSDDSEPITDTVEAQTLNTSTLNDTSHTTSMNVLEELNKKVDVLLKKFSEQKGIIDGYVKRERDWKKNKTLNTKKNKRFRI